MKSLLLLALLGAITSAPTKAPSIFQNATDLPPTLRRFARVHERAASDLVLSSNWAGATKYSKATTFVTADLVIPEPKIPPGGDSKTFYSTVFWVGIDGFTCGSGLLQTGIETAIQGTTKRYSAWFEWFPAYSINFDIQVKAGDKIRMSVGATSPTSGWAIIQNLSTGKHAQHDFRDQKGKICMTEAEWVVEQFNVDDNGKPIVIPIADFGTAQFTNAWAVQDNKVGNVKGSQLISLVKSDNETVMTGCGFDGDQSMKCFYLK